MSIVVELTWYEVEQAIFVGARREAESMRQGLEHRPRTDSNVRSNNIESAGAERAVAKVLNLDWHASINTFREGVADVGRKIEVRWRRGAYDLLVRDNDQDDRCFVLVWGGLPRYEVIGWTLGRDAKQPQFRKNYGGYGEAYFVPADQLRPVAKLKVARISLLEDVEEDASDDGTA